MDVVWCLGDPLTWIQKKITTIKAKTTHVFLIRKNVRLLDADFFAFGKRGSIWNSRNNETYLRKLIRTAFSSRNCTPTFLLHYFTLFYTQFSISSLFSISLHFLSFFKMVALTNFLFSLFFFFIFLFELLISA